MDVVSIEPSRRIVYIDIARGFGILLVVLGHSDLALVSPYLHQFIYSFHVPFFFFLSGYFFNPGIFFGKFAKKRFNTNLQPYLFTILFIFITSISFSNMRIGTAMGRFVKSLYGSGEYIWWIPLWFLPSLFITSLFAYVVYRILLIRINNRYLRWLVLLAIQAVGVFYIEAFYPFSVIIFGKEYQLYGLPYSLDIVLISGFFYMLGSEIRKLSPDKVFDNIWFLLISGGGLLTLNAIFGQRTDLAARAFESYPINTAEAILGIMFALAVSKQIELRTTHLAAALNYIGQASLFILIFHLPIQEYWAPKFMFVTGMQAFSILSAFVISILICLGIYRVFFEQNPIALYWFGRISSHPQKNETKSKSTQNREEKFPE
ncbi:MAG: acyltransferase family protein [Anaerolineales bacterium]